MQPETISLEETDCFSKTFTDYLAGKEELNPYYSLKPKLESFKTAIGAKAFSQKKRNQLFSALSRQYQGLDVTAGVAQNIEALKKEKTFTITTGHQLNIFTGPLYFLYKIITVINACKELKKKYPEYTFVPVYWMASEDHDFEEISYFYFEGKKVQWDTPQTGAVGRFSPNGLLEITNSLPSGSSFFADAYNQESLSKAVRHYVNHLFGNEGIVVIDADDAELKRSLIPVIKDDLFAHTPEKLVSKSSQELHTLGHKTQVTAREVNFFYLREDVRERIERTKEGFKVVNTELSFSEDELKKLVNSHPEHFSPNVILRPLYQEIILPNLAYVGGPSELIYWLQLKGVFDHFDEAFPILMPRNFGLVCPEKHKIKWEEMGLSKVDLFKEHNRVLTKWINANSKNKISYKEEIDQLRQIEKASKSKANLVDPTLSQHLEAIHATFTKKLQKAEKKIMRAEKRKHEEKGKQIEAIRDVLFPNGVLQERRENFLNFYLKDPTFVQKLMDAFDPFNYQMYLLYE